MASIPRETMQQLIALGIDRIISHVILSGVHNGTDPIPLPGDGHLRLLVTVELRDYTIGNIDKRV